MTNMIQCSLIIHGHKHNKALQQLISRGKWYSLLLENKNLLYIVLRQFTILARINFLQQASIINIHQHLDDGQRVNGYVYKNGVSTINSNYLRHKKQITKIGQCFFVRNSYEVQRYGFSDCTLKSLYFQILMIINHSIYLSNGS